MLKKSTAGNPAILKELFQSFIDDALEMIEQLNGSVSQNNYESYYATVHTLKGLCGTIGTTRMFEILKQMDSLNKGQDFNSSITLMSALGEIYNQTCSAIRSEIPE